MDNSKSPEFLSFVKQLNRIIEIVKKSLDDRSPNINGEKYLSCKKVCELLKISERTLQYYRNRNIIGYIQLERKILFKESDIFRLIEENYISPNS